MTSKFTVRNIFGELVKEGEVVEGVQQEQLAVIPGIYIVTIKNITKRVVIQ
jgi:hypothetical protein